MIITDLIEMREIDRVQKDVYREDHVFIVGERTIFLKLLFFISQLCYTVVEINISDQGCPEMRAEREDKLLNPLDLIWLVPAWGS